MVTHAFIPDPAASIAHGPPLSGEDELGPLTLPGFLRAVTERNANREALVHTKPDGSSERWSYAELWARSVDVAKSLIACGLGKGERVGVLMTNRAEFVAAVFGTSLAGGVAAPLSTFSTQSEVEHLLKCSACSVLLLEPQVLKKDFAQVLTALDPGISRGRPNGLASPVFPYLRHVAMLDSADPRGAMEPWGAFIERGANISTDHLIARADSVTPADPGVLFFSSGSTNKPKGILSAHRGVSLQLWRMRRQQGLGDDVRAWTANGFFWSGNFAMVLGATLAAGGTLVLQRTFDAEDALDLMQREKVTFPFAWPHQWAQLEAASNWNNVDLSSLIYADPDTPLARHPTVKTTWLEPKYSYGNTETFTFTTSYPANTTREESKGSHGPPLPGVTIKIVDPLSGRATPLGVSGEICVRSPTLMLGYVGVPLDETLDDTGFFRTGDGGYLDQEGRLFWEGRLSDIIKTGGANVSPLEIDDVIREYPGVKVSQTIGVPHDTLGELVVTCIVPHEGVAVLEEDVRQFAKEKLASYKVPRRILFFNESDLQLTGSAKVKTSDLRALAAKRLGESV